MLLGPLLFLAVLALVHHPLRVNDYTDKVTINRLQEHERRLKQATELLKAEEDEKAWALEALELFQGPEAGRKTMDEETQNTWLYTVLLLVLFVGCISVLKKEPSDDNSSTETSSSIDLDDGDGDGDSDSDMEMEMRARVQRALEEFCDSHMETSSSDLTHKCSFVETFVNNLLEACRNALPDQNTLPLLENCIGVDSAFEGWHTHLSKAFCVLGPLGPPKGHSFHLETSPLSKHGHILVETECMCKRESFLRDVRCCLHHPEENPSPEKQSASLVHLLCTGSHLDVEKTIHWFQGLVGQAWKNVQYQYDLDLLPQPSSTSCKLKLAFRSGGTISVDIILGVQQGDSLAFLASQGDEMECSTGTVWQRTFAVQERLFFERASRRAPEESCHLKCLQILVCLRESSPSARKNPLLTSYHYKTCLMHLLLRRPPSDWAREEIAQRLQDVLAFMNAALQEKRLDHFVIGNISLPVRLPVPSVLRTAAPVNLFKDMAEDPDLHAEAMREFVKVAEKARALVTEWEE